MSLLALLGDEAARAAAARAANAAGLAHLEAAASVVRFRRGGATAWEPASGLAVASFVHATSRSDDPHLHVHNVIANHTETLTGRSRAVNASALYAAAAEASALATAALRAEFSASLGVSWALDAERNTVEIEGTPRCLVEEFSQRRASRCWNAVDSLRGTAIAHGRPTA